MMPLRTVEKKGQTAIPQLYAEHRLKLDTLLAPLTCGLVVHPNLTSLTVHYVDSDFTLQSKTLQTAYFPDDNTAGIIAQGLLETLTTWGLEDDRMACITTDSGANIVMSCHYWLGGSLSQMHLPSFSASLLFSR